jgi:hypothetical protein
MVKKLFEGDVSYPLHLAKEDQYIGECIGR